MVDGQSTDRLRVGSFNEQIWGDLRERDPASPVAGVGGSVAGVGGSVARPAALPVATTPTTATPATSAPAPRVPAPTVTLPKLGVVSPVPEVPGIFPLQTSQYSVVVSWYDRSTDELAFIVYRRDAQGNWQNVHEVATHDEAGQGEDYSWVDTDRNQSGQCYRIAAAGLIASGYSGEQCTVRPDPSQFPQSVPAATRQWYGLSGANGGTGTLQTDKRDSDTNLVWSDSDWTSVALDWSEGPSLWKVQAQGGPQVMYGQAVALRVWGGGWLKYGVQGLGVDLQFSDTPSYEWYVLGEPPGTSIPDGQDFAVWDSAAHDYLVFGHETWGVSLNSNT